MSTREGEAQTQWAYLLEGETLHFAQYSTHLSSDRGPFSAVTELVQGIWGSNPEYARQILRHRVVTNLEKNERDWGMIKVSAKSISFDDPSAEKKIQSHSGPRCEYSNSKKSSERSGEGIYFPSGVACTLNQALMRVRELSAQVRRTEQAYSSDRNVAALLMTSQGEVLVEAINRNAENKTLHAEVRVAQAYFQKYQQLIPDDLVWVTSLKPCKMCAGMIWVCSSDQSKLRVYFDEHDPGPKANPTVLDLHQCQTEI